MSDISLKALADGCPVSRRFTHLPTSPAAPLHYWTLPPTSHHWLYPIDSTVTHLETQGSGCPTHCFTPPTPPCAVPTRAQYSSALGAPNPPPPDVRGRNDTLMNYMMLATPVCACSMSKCNNFQLLTHVNVSWCQSITESGVEALARGCPKLKSFICKGKPRESVPRLRIDDSGIESLGPRVLGGGSARLLLSLGRSEL